MEGDDALGLVNLVAVACGWNTAPRWPRQLAWPAAWCAVAFGWGVLLAAWLVATLLIPPASDNRPRRGPISPSFESEEIPLS